MQVRQSINPIYSEAFARAVIAAYKAAPLNPLADALEVRLISDAAMVYNPQKTEADYAAGEATFTDYVLKSPTLTEPVNLGADVEGATASATWSLTTDPTVITNTIYGYFLVAGTLVVMAEKFPTGQEVTMAEYGDQLTLIVALPFRSRQAVA